MRNKLIQLQGLLAQGLVGRENAIRVALLGLIAGENTLFIGPPGTAKSMIARRVSEAINPEGQHGYFEYLLTKFSTPEELFGPLSLTALKQDQFKRNTTGYLPTVKVVFLDEIFKASSSILNSLLTILNERKFHNGNASEIIPLQSLIAASNELPKGQPELAALYDRFLLRYFIDYLESSQRESLFDLEALSPLLPENQLNLSDLTLIIRRAKQVTFPAEIQQVIQQIWKEHQEIFKENADEHLSDRRFVKVINLLRFSAATNERQHTDLSDVMLLKDCLWNDDANAGKVGEIVRGVLQRFDRIVTLETTYHEPILITPTVNQTPATNVLKGYRGSGTADDPFLIEGLDHLISLQRPEVGQKGHYFKQTVDIDCKNIDTWPVFKFNGNYNGNDKSIIFRPGSSLPFSIGLGIFGGFKEESINLFEEVFKSEIRRLTLVNACLCNIVIKSKLALLRTNKSISNIIDETIVSFCYSEGSIANHAKKSHVNCCHSMNFLIREELSDSLILNCIASITHIGVGEQYQGGIAKTATNSTIDECYIEAKLDHRSSSSWLYFSSIISESKANTTVKNSAIGSLDWDGDVSMDYALVPQEDNLILFNNIHLQTERSGNFNDKYLSGRSGQTVSSESFNQYYFENNLDWDFENTWSWDSQLGHPVLRPYGENIVKGITSTDDSSSLLHEQLRRNIWLARQVTS